MLMANQDGLKMQVLRDLQRREGGQIIGDKLFPLRDHLMSLADEAPMCTTIGDWYVLEADARQDRQAVRSVAAEGYVAYQPIVIKNQVVRHRLRQIERAMFGKYFFVKCQLTDESYQRIRLARGVRRFLDLGDGRPRSVPNWAMDIVRLKEAEFGTPVGQSRFVYHFSPGDKVRIKNGPFQWFYAQLESAVDEHGRLTALIDLFGRETRVQLEATQVEAN
jgi:transcriptional antiterminator NusG